MRNKKLGLLWNAILLGFAGAISGCGDSTPSTATLFFDRASPVPIEMAGIHRVELVLSTSSAVVGQRVSVSPSDGAIVDVIPNVCVLSSDSAESGSCTLTLHGKAAGSTTLTARSEGYPDATIVATVTDTPLPENNGAVALSLPLSASAAVGATSAADLHYGRLTVQGADGKFYSGGPVELNYDATGPGPYSLKIHGRLDDSTGIEEVTGALINFDTLGNKALAPAPGQCQVTTSRPDCETTVSFNTPDPVTLMLKMAGKVTSSYTKYNTVTVKATPDTNPKSGKLVIQTQDGNAIADGMTAPLFVNWIGQTASDEVDVTLKIEGAGAQFYSYEPGNNLLEKHSPTASCTLRSRVAGQPDAMSCGFGLRQVKSEGSTPTGQITVSGTAKGRRRPGESFEVQPLTIGLVPQKSTRRAITFVNESSEDIYVGITGGASRAYVDPLTSSTNEGKANKGNLKPGAGSECGLTNPLAACPIGTTCRQGGAAPSPRYQKDPLDDKAGFTPYYCYYDQGRPQGDYLIPAKSGSTTLEIPGSSVSPDHIIWSGNFYARTGCDPATGVCTNATCRGVGGGLACGPGTGPSPGVNTLAEVTFQAGTSPDFYDVSIINGANFSAQFGPTSVPVSASESFTCGLAGSRLAQNGGYPPALPYSSPGPGLPAASWKMGADQSSFPASTTVNGSPTSYFRLVSPSDKTPVQCTADSVCSNEEKCGYSMPEFAAGSFTAKTRYCGKPVAWLTANALWGNNQSNEAPFQFGQSWEVKEAGKPPVTVTVGDLQLCINGTYSPYQKESQPLALACGGVMWGETDVTPAGRNPSNAKGLLLTRTKEGVQSVNSNWIDYVLPTLRWLKAACPTCYTWPFDDMASTFTCTESKSTRIDYRVTFGDLQ